MKYLISILLPALLIFGATPQETVEKLASSPTLEHGLWSVYAQYCDTGEPVVDYNSSYSLAPASGLKIMASGAALLKLGPDFHYETTVDLDGVQKRTCFDGDLVIHGSGDPTLGSDIVAVAVSPDSFYQGIVNALISRNIRKLTGDIVVDNSLFGDRKLPDGWIWQDIGNYYGAALQSFCFGENLYYITFQPGENPGDPAGIISTRPVLHDFNFINTMRTGKPGSGDNGYIYSAPGMTFALVRGTVPAAVPEFTIKGAVEDPAANTAKELRLRLQDAGISVKGRCRVLDRKTETETSSSEELCRFRSPSLERIIAETLQRSVNLFAEQLIRTAAWYGDGESDYDASVAEIKTMLDSLKVPRAGFSIADGSGLSRGNKVTTRVFSDFLAAMSRKDVFSSYYSSFSIAGDTTAIGHYMSFGENTAAKGNARIKTGFIGSVRSHSGYVTDRNGRMIAFSCIANNYSGRTSDVNRIHEQVLDALASIDNK